MHLSNYDLTCAAVPLSFDRDDGYNGGSLLLRSPTPCPVNEQPQLIEHPWTQVSTPYVNHIATMTGGVGFQDLARFYKVRLTASVSPLAAERYLHGNTVRAVSLC